MKNKSFTSERLALRPFTANDVQVMQMLDLDEEVVRYLGTGRKRTREETASNLSKILRDYEIYGLGLFAVHNKNTQEFIGRSGLIPWVIDDNLVWEVGYSFIRQEWGKGYASESARMLANWAHQNLAVNSVISLIHPLNTASIHVAEKMGMRFLKQREINDVALSVYQLDF